MTQVEFDEEQQRLRRLVGLPSPVRSAAEDQTAGTDPIIVPKPKLPVRQQAGQLDVDRKLIALPCANCGASISDAEAVYCPRCGERVVDEESEAVAKRMWTVDRRFVGVALVLAGLVLQFDELEGVLLGGFTQVVGLAMAVVGLLLLVWRVNRRLLGGSVLIVVALLLVPVGLLAGWPVADNQPGLLAAVPIWGMAVALFVVSVKAVRRVFHDRRVSGVRTNLDIPRSVWFLLSAVFIALAVSLNPLTLRIVSVVIAVALLFGGVRFGTTRPQT